MGNGNVGPRESSQPQQQCGLDRQWWNTCTREQVNDRQWERYREVKLPSTLSFPYDRSVDTLYMIEVQNRWQRRVKKTGERTTTSVSPSLKLT